MFSPQHVMCHVSRVTCNVSHVTFFSSFFLQSGEAYRLRVCYQRGLPRLVFILKTTCVTVTIMRTSAVMVVIMRTTGVMVTIMRTIGVVMVII